MHILPINNFIKNIRKIKRCVTREFYPEKYPYILKVKTDKCEISTLNNFKFNIPKDADTYTKVVIGKRRDKKYSKEITSFFKNNKIITRYTTEGNNVIEKIYSHDAYNNSHFMPTVRRTVKTFVHSENSKEPVYKKFEHMKIVRHDKREYHMFSNENVFENSAITSRMKAHFKYNSGRIEIEDLETHINIGSDGTPTFREKNDSLHCREDEFAPYRFIFDPHKQRLALTHYFLKKYHLDNLGIKISEDELQKDIVGEFGEYSASITYDKNFNPMYNREEYNLPDPLTENIKLAAHEVRHAYQYSLIGRLGKKQEAPWCKICNEKLGKITDSKEYKRARNYLKADKKYPPNDDGKNSDIRYNNNYLEVDAQKAEQEAAKEYLKSKLFISRLEIMLDPPYKH